MILENEMVHGRLPRSRGVRQQRQLRSVRNARRGHQPPKAPSLPEHGGWGEWDASARLWKEIQTRLDEAGETDRPPRRQRARIEDDTGIVPCAVAEYVCEEACLGLSEPLAHEWVLELAERANVIYQHNARFRQLLQKRGDAGRDWLAAFMRHWLSALLASRRPDLCQRLLRSHAIGHPIHDTRP